MNAVPEAIRQSEMDKLSIFMTAEDKSSVLADFTLVDSSSANYDSYLAKYPVLATEPVYVLNKIDAISIEELDLLDRVPHYVPISAKDEWNLDELMAKIWEYLNLIS